LHITHCQRDELDWGGDDALENCCGKHMSRAEQTGDFVAPCDCLDILWEIHGSTRSNASCFIEIERFCLAAFCFQVGFFFDLFLAGAVLATITAVFEM